ncbi:winged helix-turn-helix domain-containing protein [Streptomyces sp. NPDC002722]|uniref:winged helix-turn-helix domain-containing protein n=1 Tax=Streptomyces sp. NPDC002722 TaxID=3154425 RepID=UPI00333247C6
MPASRYKTLVDAFAADIRTGRLAAGTRLPTHRGLAAREGIAVVTATRVYAELEAMGLVSREQGRGTFVQGLVPILGGGRPVSLRRSQGPSASDECPMYFERVVGIDR